MPDSICFAYLYLFKDLRGITRYTIDVSNALTSIGKKVYVICPYRKDRLPERYLDRGVNCLYIPHYRYKRITSIPGFLWFFLTNRFDSINISLGFGEAYAAVTAKRIRRDFHYNVLLHMAYEKDYLLFSKLYKRGLNIGLFDKADKIIAVSDYVKKTVENIINPEKVFVSYNGVDLDRFYYCGELRKKKREELGLRGDELVLLTTSALAFQKNIRKVFPAMRELIDSGLRIKYVIAGYGSKKDIEFLMMEIDRFGLNNDVLYLGEVESTVSLYSASDIFVLLSQYEAFGISVIEAAACGLPCITSDESAFPEIVNKDIGFRVNKEDVAGMIKIIKMLRYDKVRENFRYTARERVKRHFDVRENIRFFL
ncbi:glycosyltransferase family 4 protein [bacterium]|nr:glycosyltransferase family 4 protein [bacterium]